MTTPAASVERRPAPGRMLQRACSCQGCGRGWASFAMWTLVRRIERCVFCGSRQVTVGPFVWLRPAA